MSDQFVHLIAGGLGGTVGAVVTCPLEVIKTRLQSSVAKFGQAQASGVLAGPKLVSHTANSHTAAQPPKQVTILRAFQHVIQTEGARGLWKGIVPNIVGIAPSRAIYFLTYSSTKTFANAHMSCPDTPYVHVISAFNAGFVSCTITNPIWFIKTRMQLDESLKGMSTMKCIKDIYSTAGLAAFYKGLSASYFGISETIIHFVIYEYLKSRLSEKIQSENREKCQDNRAAATGILMSNSKGCSGDDDTATGSSQPEVTPKPANPESKLNLFHFMAAAATSKFCASVMTYPHEVARTRLREEGDKYRGFFRTLILVYQEEGVRNGLYRGLATHLLRQIPNTAITMGIYEVAAYFLKSLLHPPPPSLVNSV